MENRVVEEVKTQVLDVVKEANLIVNTPEDYEKSSQILKRARQMLKMVDEKEKEVTRPLNEALRKARELFEPLKQTLKQVISLLNSNLSAFRQRQLEEARKKQEEVNKVVKPDDLFKPVVEPEIPKTEIKTRKLWKWKVVDKSQIKPDFLIPDEKTINEIVRKMHEKAEGLIGGIRVYYEEVSY